MTDKQKPTGAETWQDKMPKVPRYYSPTELLERRVSRLEQDIKELRGIYASEKNIIIGALTTHYEVAHSSIIKEKIKGLSYLASKIADNAV